MYLKSDQEKTISVGSLIYITFKDRQAKWDLDWDY